jgi:O-methyltransferase
VFKDAAKSIIRMTSPAVARHLPVENWPAWLGRIHGVKVPRAVVPQSVPAPTGGANIKILLRMIVRTKDLEGHIAECGVFQGGSAVAMGLYLRQQRIEKRVYGFDSFEGFDPESARRDLQLGGAYNDDRHEHGFNETSGETVLAKVTRFGLTNIELVPGYFSESLRKFSGSTSFCFVHLDVDLYDSYRDCLEFFYPRLVTGGIILLDEYNDPPWPGCNKAVDEFMAGKPEILERIDSDHYEKWYFVKIGSGGTLL